MQPSTLYSTRNRANIEPPPITFGPSLTTDEGAQERLRTKFGKKYENILNRYGVVDYVYDEAGTEIIDVVNPEDYLAEIDNRILHMVETGAPDDKRLVPTSKLLHRLARTEVSFLSSFPTFLRSNPQYVHSLITENTKHRTELILDETGTAPKVEHLLKNADFLATQIRYTIHNNLLVLGRWALVEKLLKELVEHEDDVGYGPAKVRRQVLMDQARFLIEQAMDDCAHQVSRILCIHPKFQMLWVRVFTYEPKWTGARVAPRTEHPYAIELRHAQTLNGALYRCSFYQQADLLELADLFSFFRKATLEEIHELGGHLVENISRLQAFYNFYHLLGIRDKSQYFKVDSRLHDFKANSEKAQKILDGAAIERHIKDIDSLGQEKTLQKIWEECDTVSQKKVRAPLEKLIGYEKLPPRWDISPRRVRIRPETRPTAPTRSPSLRPQIQLAPHQQPVVHEPVRLTPVSYLQEAVLRPVEQTPPRTGPKVKTTGIPNPPSSNAGVEHHRMEEGDHEREDTRTSPFELPFYVKKSAYEVFEQLFNPALKGHVRQGDFISAMRSLGWEYVDSYAGSRARLIPPAGNQPFVMHIIHGGDGDKMSDAYEHTYARRLTEDYGFTMDSFRVKE